MPRFTVRDQLRLGYLAVIAVLLTPLVAAVMYIGRTADTFSRSDEHHDLIVRAQDLAVAAQYNSRDIAAYALGRVVSHSQYERHRQGFIAAMAQLEAGSAYLTPGQRELVLELSGVRERFDIATMALFEAIDRKRTLSTPQAQTDADAALDAADTLSVQLDSLISELTASLRADVEVEAEAIRGQIAAATVLALVFGVVGVGASVVISQWVSGRIVTPIARLAAVARDVASGDLTQRANIVAPNEIEELGANFDLMTEQLSESIGALETGLIEAHLARERAESAEKIKGAFLANMSHELRTPLNAIINFTRFVADGDIGEINQQQKDLLNEVINSGRHLLSLINDVLDMSKIEAGALNMTVEDGVSVAELLHTLATICSGLIADKPVRVRTDIPDDLPTVRADRQRLYQSLLNIAANAVKFTDEGEIRIAAWPADDSIEIAISDTGPGIAPEDVPAVFAAFKQTESGLRTGRGTGLGMPIARSLIEAHGGAIRLESVVGRGATFTVTLPIKSSILTPSTAAVGRVL